MPTQLPQGNNREGVPPLRSIYIYLTDECNQRCPHCWINPVLEGRSKLMRPSLDQYLQFIDAARPMGLNYLKVTGGEPLLREETFPILEHVSAAGISSTVETNAMLVGEREAEFFSSNNVHVGISLDAADSETHDRRRGLKGAFRRTMRAVEIMSAAGIDLTVTAAVSRSNLGEIERILELLNQTKGERQLTFKVNPIVPMGRARHMKKRGETLEPEELLELTEKVRTQLLPRFKNSRLHIMVQLELAFFPIQSILNAVGTRGAGHCGFLSLISLLADGSITFCGIGYAQRELIMGNIRENYDLPDIWNHHPLMTDTRNKVRHGLEGVCRHCLFHPVCLGGCRASAVLVGGSVASSPPWCQSLYDAGLFPTSRLDDEGARAYARIAPRLRREHEARIGLQA